METVYLAENIVLASGSRSAIFTFASDLAAGENYIVNVNGTEYEYTCMTTESGKTYLGNAYIANSSEVADNGEPVGVLKRATGKYFVGTVDTSAERTISVYLAASDPIPVGAPITDPVSFTMGYQIGCRLRAQRGMS